MGSYNLGRDWLLSLSRIFSRFTYVVARTNISFLLIANQYFLIWIYHILSICSPVNGHLDCFHFSGYYKWCCYKHSCTNFSFHFCGYILLRNRIIRSYANSTFNICELFSKATTLTFTPAMLWEFWFLQILTNTYLVFLVTAMLVGMKWHLMWFWLAFP